MDVGIFLLKHEWCCNSHRVEGCSWQREITSVRHLAPSNQGRELSYMHYHKGLTQHTELHAR